MSIYVKHLPRVSVAYKTYIGDLDEKTNRKIINKNYKELQAWANNIGILDYNPLFLGLIYDTKELLKEEIYRYDSCLTIQGGLSVPNIFDIKTLEEGDYITINFNLSFEEVDNIETIVANVFKKWMPENNYIRDVNKPCMEIYLPSKNDIPTFVMDYYIPIK